MAANLFIQILGNSDVLVDSKEGIEQLQGYTLEEVEYYAQISEKEILQDLSRIDFPLIHQFVRGYQTSQENYLIVFLTNQTQWIEKQAIQGTYWNRIIASDGFWWNNILKQWCEQQQINYYPIFLKIPPDIQKGVADWEGMARLINSKISQYIKSDNSSVKFLPSENQVIEVDKIILQHSSGTPALSSALYLWGIEQKMARLPVEFCYLSRQDSSYYSHSGEHWQWRFKIPQIQQLLSIQDFDGILTLLQSFPDRQLTKNIRRLDRSISFNLMNLGFNPKESVIERIAITLWSEEAFALRGKWMDWYLRMAGAFELAIYCLVEQNSHGQYHWEQSPEKTFLKHTATPQEFRLEIKKTVQKLLTEGECKETWEESYKIQPIQDNNWKDFLLFYCDKGWELSRESRYSFLHLRNQLYHKLLGDTIDEKLDQKSKTLGSATAPNHPSRKAVKYLNYIVNLAGINAEVIARRQYYQSLIKDVKDALERYQ